MLTCCGLIERSPSYVSLHNTQPINTGCQVPGSRYLTNIQLFKNSVLPFHRYHNEHACEQHEPTFWCAHPTAKPACSTACLFGSKLFREHACSAARLIGGKLVRQQSKKSLNKHAGLTARRFFRARARLSTLLCTRSIQFQDVNIQLIFDIEV